MMFAKLYRRLTEPFRRSIRNKLILTMVVLSVLPIIAVTALAAENNRRSMENEVIDTNLSNMKWTGIYLGEQFAGLNNLIYTLLISPNLSDYMALSEEASLSSRFAAQRNMIDTMTSVYYSGNNNVVGLQLYLTERNKLFTINAMQSDLETPAQVPSLYADLFAQQKNFMIQTKSGDREKFLLIRSFNRFENREVLGGISLEVRWTMLDQTLSLLNPSEEDTVLIARPDGSILYQPYGEAPPASIMEAVNRSGNDQGRIRTQHEYVFYTTIDPVGLKLIKIIPTSFINRSAQATMYYGVIIGAISVMVALLIAVALAWRTSKPIVALARSLQGLSMIKETEAPHSGRIDEIGLLETRLNGMSHRIREHIKTEYSMSLEKKTAELKALQAQINPHFLQNTLQLIGSMLFAKNPADSYEIVKSLSDMFRYVIREPEDLATVRSEVDHLNNYMLIQKQRFSTRLRYNIEVGERTSTARIPKLTLQPIVENAFFHGLEAKPGDWQLEVAIVRDGENVRISVRDNGIGMDAGRLAELRKGLDAEIGQVWTHGNRIGLHNVASRIRMQFGQAYGVTVDSEPGKGTLVTFIIPAATGGELEA